MRSRATFLAICVVAQADEDARLGAVTPTLGLRLALAYLYAVGDRRKEWFDREPYDEFWTVATTRTEHGDNAAGFGRSQVLTAHLNAMARAAGMEMDVTMLARVRREIMPARR